MRSFCALLTALVLLAFVYQNTYASSDSDRAQAPSRDAIINPPDSMCADFMGKHWIATSCKIDTVADEWLSAQKHAFVFEIVGIGDTDTLHIDIPNYLGAPAYNNSPGVAKTFEKDLPAADITPRLLNYHNATGEEVVYYRYAPLDTGDVDTSDTFPIDYAYSYDAALHVPQTVAEGHPVQVYVSSNPHDPHPVGAIHITHLDSNYIAGTFRFDVKPNTLLSNKAIRITKGRFKFSFPKLADE